MSNIFTLSDLYINKSDITLSKDSAVVITKVNISKFNKILITGGGKFGSYYDNFIGIWNVISTNKIQWQDVTDIAPLFFTSTNNEVFLIDNNESSTIIYPININMSIKTPINNNILLLYTNDDFNVSRIGSIVACITKKTNYDFVLVDNYNNSGCYTYLNLYNKSSTIETYFVKIPVIGNLIYNTIDSNKIKQYYTTVFDKKYDYFAINNIITSSSLMKVNKMDYLNKNFYPEIVSGNYTHPSAIVGIANGIGSIITGDTAGGLQSSDPTVNCNNVLENCLTSTLSNGKLRFIEPGDTDTLLQYDGSELNYTNNININTVTFPNVGNISMYNDDVVVNSKATYNTNSPISSTLYVAKLAEGLLIREICDYYVGEFLDSNNNTLSYTYNNNNTITINGLLKYVETNKRIIVNTVFDNYFINGIYDTNITCNTTVLTRSNDCNIDYINSSLTIKQNIFNGIQVHCGDKLYQLESYHININGVTKIIDKPEDVAIGISHLTFVLMNEGYKFTLNVPGIKNVLMGYNNLLDSTGLLIRSSNSDEVLDNILIVPTAGKIELNGIAEEDDENYSSISNTSLYVDNKKLKYEYSILDTPNLTSNTIATYNNLKTNYSSIAIGDINTTHNNTSVAFGLVRTNNTNNVILGTGFIDENSNNMAVLNQKYTSNLPPSILVKPNPIVANSLRGDPCINFLQYSSNVIALSTPTLIYDSDTIKNNLSESIQIPSKIDYGSIDSKAKLPTDPNGNGSMFIPNSVSIFTSIGGIIGYTIELNIVGYNYTYNGNYNPTNILSIELKDHELNTGHYIEYTNIVALSFDYIIITINKKNNTNGSGISGFRVLIKGNLIELD